MPTPIEDGARKRYTYDFQDPPNALAHNGVESVSIYMNSEEEIPVLCTFYRSQGTANEPLIFNFYKVYGPEPPERLPSTLPPPDHLSLHLSLGQRLGHGRSGGVYDVNIDFTNSSPELKSLAFPPLVAKVSRPKREKELEHEAFYYEEMETIQGIVIPRCYGFFTGKIPRDHLLVGETDVSSEFPTDSEESMSEASNLKNEDSERPQFTYNHAANFRVVSILLLEKLGDRLPVGKKLPEDLTAEIVDMYRHFGQFGIDHIDIRYANILEAPECPPGWPSLMSPLTHNAYRYRLIDFGNSRKTNRALEFFPSYYFGYVNRLLNGLTGGYIVEPWEV
ncbi:hypothetical protein NM688_g7038 [Phlebia brevispora]|uniref:Uncharacterized protein n=1 Tax=Phlebia brevispora TaxID=194682 RepID=A0ACC1S9U1_9APHY|nr:hypothetical protein NM688_g7038 [Phlebia brevispora]